MTSRCALIQNKLGLHARAAAKFVHVATAYHSRVRVARDGREVDGKSIMGILFLAAPAGATLRISASGEDEAAAVEALCALVESRFGERE